MTKTQRPKISVYLSDAQAEAIKALPRGLNMSEKLREKIDEILAEYDRKRD